MCALHALLAVAGAVRLARRVDLPAQELTATRPTSTSGSSCQRAKLQYEVRPSFDDHSANEVISHMENLVIACTSASTW
jgi:hypothetical protein